MLSYAWPEMTQVLEALERVGLIKVSKGVEFQGEVYEQEPSPLVGPSTAATPAPPTLSISSASSDPPSEDVPSALPGHFRSSTDGGVLSHAQEQRPLMSPKHKRRRSSVPKLAKNLVREVLVDPIAQFNMNKQHATKSKTKVWGAGGDGDERGSVSGGVSGGGSASGAERPSPIDPPPPPSPPLPAAMPPPPPGELPQRQTTVLGPSASNQHEELCRQLRLCVDDILM